MKRYGRPSGAIVNVSTDELIDDFKKQVELVASYESDDKTK